MYLPPQFNSRDPRIAARLMREHPFASLISTDDEGLPFITHLPLHVQELPAPAAQGLEAEKAPDFVLLGHVARPNPHGAYLAARPKAVATFLGPHAYMSPSVYPDLARVPTWSYLAVHCTVSCRILEAPEAKDALLKHLIADHEPAYAQQWRDLGEEFGHKMLRGITAFELRVTDWQCKLKLNQHRPESHAAMHAAYAAGTPDERALAGWMTELGLTGRAQAQEN